MFREAEVTLSLSYPSFLRMNLAWYKVSWYIKGLGTRPAASLRSRGPWVFMACHAIMRCPHEGRRWMRNCVGEERAHKVYRSVLPARLINDIFKRLDEWQNRDGETAFTWPPL